MTNMVLSLGTGPALLPRVSSNVKALTTETFSHLLYEQHPSDAIASVGSLRPTQTAMSCWCPSWLPLVSWRTHPFSALMFAMVAMRADFSYVITCIARFSANPGLPHWNALVRVYQYAKGTADLKLTYSRMADTPAPLM